MGDRCLAVCPNAFDYLPEHLPPACAGLKIIVDVYPSVPPSAPRRALLLSPASQAKRSSRVDRIVECVPNFSEGRRAEVIARLEEAIASVDGALVLDRHAEDVFKAVAKIERRADEQPKSAARMRADTVARGKK